MLKKVSQQALVRARNEVGAKRTPIKMTDREWEAIQAGAISENVLRKSLITWTSMNFVLVQHQDKAPN